jgi:hypothetical protein
MNDTPHSEPTRARMQQIRGDIDRDLEEMVESARSMVDWKHYVKTYPWLCLGTAMAVGFLLVPKRSTPPRPDSATVTELATTGQLVVKPTAMRGAVDALLTTAVNIAVRQATACAGRSVGRLLQTRRDKSAPPAVGCVADRAGRSSC